MAKGASVANTSATTKRTTRFMVYLLAEPTARCCVSIHFGARRLHDPRVLDELAVDELGELRRLIGRGLRTLRGETLAHRRCRKNLRHAGIPFRDYIRRRAGRRKQPEPRRDVEAGHARFSHRRQL